MRRATFTALGELRALQAELEPRRELAELDAFDRNLLLEGLSELGAEFVSAALERKTPQQ